MDPRGNQSQTRHYRYQMGCAPRLMDAHADDCLVSGFEPLIESLSLPDPHDRHVLAAAVKGRADVFVTFNLKQFPDTS